MRLRGLYSKQKDWLGHSLKTFLGYAYNRGTCVRHVFEHSFFKRYYTHTHPHITYKHTYTQPARKKGRTHQNINRASLVSDCLVFLYFKTNTMVL